MNSHTRRFCQECGAELADDDAQGLCPRCLLKAGLGTQPEPSAGSAQGQSPAPDQALPEAGKPFGRYRIVRALGRGGMGVVYEAEEQDTGRRVALKVLGQQLNSPEDRARFLREGRLAASINHPNCVYVYGTEEIDGTPTIAMELVPGDTLQRRVQYRGPMPVSAAVDAILQIIAGLEAAQAIGILHRDIKPGNCFADADGTIKIGDFGLSISTAARAETNVTATGTMVGTPAFCSPEQLRGEELNVRSDIYSVGVTLFYLLTGRVPFEGHNLAQLVANVLERRTPSPCRFRTETPKGLANATLRCLEKQPGERFKSYAELRRALAPYGSTAPTPATLGLRFLAGVLDHFALSAPGFFLMLLLWSGNLADFIDAANRGSLKARGLMLAGFGLSLLYFTVLEGLWGITLGKALCRLRVVRPDKNPPGLARALVRALFYVVVPVLPTWIIMRGDPSTLLRLPSAVSYLVQFSWYFMIALIFCTVRRRNGFAALHDLITSTRVISRVALEARPVISTGETAPVAVETKPMTGPYHILESLGKSADEEWLLGYDLRLLRKVWIHVVPPGTPVVAAPLRNLGRAGRLRWITGRRSPEENWDAFEAVSGQPLLRLIQNPQPWGRVRFWLYDLAGEIRAAEKDGTLPPVLALDRVWVTGDGRAKLLDFAAPGLKPTPNRAGARQGAAEFRGGSLPRCGTVTAFLSEVAAAALKGGSAAPGEFSGEVPVPLPLHARDFLEKLPQLLDAEAITGALKPLLPRPAVVTRMRRAAVVAGCMALPLFAAAFLVFGAGIMQQWNQRNPGLMELSALLRQRSMMRFWGKAEQLPGDQQYAVFIATHYRSIITNDDGWSSPMALMMIKGNSRRFAEQSVAEHAAPTEKEIAEADAALKPFVRRAAPPGPPKLPEFPILVANSVLVIYVGVPALLAALLFRGGLVLRIANVTFVRRDGARASRLRMFWRALVAWSAAPLAIFLYDILKPLYAVWGLMLACALVCGLAILSVVLPNRGLPDRLAGTWPVPR